MDDATAQKVALALETAKGLPSVSKAEGLAIAKEMKTLRTSHPKAVSKVEAQIAAARIQATSKFTAAALASEVPTLRTLNVTHYSQSNGYYCGPATAQMILKHKGKSSSADKGTSLTQANVASTSYLGTTSSTGTPWASKRMATGLTKWIGSQTYQQVQSPSVSVLKGAFVSSANAGYPLAVSTVEFANGDPTSKTIGHWIVGRSYDSAGANLGFLDPATSVYTGVSASFGSTATNFQKFVNTNGIAY